jgi:hypothetical protein
MKPFHREISESNVGCKTSVKGFHIGTVHGTLSLLTNKPSTKENL